MIDFVANFDAPMKTATIKGALYGTRVSIATTDPMPEPKTDTTATSVASIEAALQRIETELAAQRSQLQSSAVTFAVEIARVLLSSFDDVIEQRIRDNVLRVLAEPDGQDLPKLFVHSSCRDTVADLMLPDGNSEANGGNSEANGVKVELLVDERLAPGDCRVDFGQSGRLASLDDQLRVIKTKLEQSIVPNQPAGKP